MAKCANCESRIRFGAVRVGDLRFCNQNCQEEWHFLSLADQLSPALIAETVERLHEGPCPRCRGRGPVDVHLAYYHWSLIVWSHTGVLPWLSCQSCGIRNQVQGIIFTLLFGWWGPEGLVISPLQIYRNIVAMVRGLDPLVPSELLHKSVKVGLAIKAFGDPEKPSKGRGRHSQ